MATKRPSMGLMLIKCLVVLYDVITFPIYFLIQKPWERVARHEAVRARRLVESDPHSPYVRVGQPVQHYVREC
ncbi:unnamed protein product, partial [Medioppia subpectinata]